MLILFNFINNITNWGFFIKKFINHRSKTFLISYFEFLAILNALSLKNLSEAVLWILSLLLVNDPQALQVSPDCFKCISGINLSLTNKNLLTISLIFIIAFSGAAFKTRYHPIMESYLMVFWDLNYLIFHLLLVL